MGRRASTSKDSERHVLGYRMANDHWYSRHGSNKQLHWCELYTGPSQPLVPQLHHRTLAHSTPRLSHRFDKYWR